MGKLFRHDALVTAHHSNTVSAERAERRKRSPTRLAINSGIAGRAFTKMETQIVADVSKLKTGDFVNPWDDDVPIPQSLISCPFKVNGVATGVLNIDSMIPNTFGENVNQKYLAQTLSDFLAHILQMIYFLEEHRSWGT